MIDPSTSRARLPSESDGELVGQIFCTYCGNLNETAADVCTSCGHYIADQGPDLSARLRRIRRYASQSPELNAQHESTDVLMGVDAPIQRTHWLEAVTTRIGPYTRANILLACTLFSLGLGMIFIFRGLTWTYVVGVFCVGAFLLIRSRVTPKPLAITGDECVERLQRAGFQIAREREKKRSN